MRRVHLSPVCKALVGAFFPAEGLDVLGICGEQGGSVGGLKTVGLVARL